MATVLQVIDVDSEGHKVRLSDGRVLMMPHGGEHPHIGQEVTSSGASEQQSIAPTSAALGPAPETISLGGMVFQVSDKFPDPITIISGFDQPAAPEDSTFIGLPEGVEVPRSNHDHFWLRTKDAAEDSTDEPIESDPSAEG